MKRICIPVLTLLCLLSVTSFSAAGVLLLDGLADPTTQVVEYNHDVGAGSILRMNAYDPYPQQRFFDYDDPTIFYGNSAYDGFPNENNFRLGDIDYDDSGLIGGTGIAPITAVRLGINRSPLDNDYFNYNRWDGTNVIDTFDGTVTLLNGVVTSVDLTTSGVFTFTPSLTTYTLPGTFSISGNQFTGSFEGLAPFNNIATYTFSGTLSTVAVPEPGLAAVASLALLGLIGFRRYSQAKR